MRSIILSAFLLFSFAVYSQTFKGKALYANYYLDKQTMNPIAPTIMENVWMNDNFQRVNIVHDSANTGGLDWQIFDYQAGFVYSKENYAGAKISKESLCKKEANEFTHLILDTIMSIKGFPAHVMIIKNKGQRVAEFYYSNKFKVSPAYYTCFNNDILSYFYKNTKGAFILQRVEFGDLYTWIYQVQEMHPSNVDEKEFKLPKHS